MSAPLDDIVRLRFFEIVRLGQVVAVVVVCVITEWGRPLVLFNGVALSAICSCCWFLSLVLFGMFPSSCHLLGGKRGLDVLAVWRSEGESHTHTHTCNNPPTLV